MPRLPSIKGSSYIPEMSSSRQFTDAAGRTFYYSDGRRIYVDGGEDSGTPVPYKPERYPPTESRPLTPPKSPTTGFLLETEKLRSMLSKYLGIRVPGERLLACETAGDLLGVVLPLLPALGATYEERRAVEDKISRMGLASYKWAMHRVICTFKCVICGEQLGAQALRLGARHFAGLLDDLHKNHRERLISIRRDTHAVCPRCRSRYRYTDQRTLVRLEDPDS
jgi:hypothetical protein